MLARLRNALRRWLGVSDPAPPEPAQPAGFKIDPALLAAMPGLKGNPAALVAYQGMPVVARKVKAPELFPGVVPDNAATLAVDGMGPYVALDSEANAPMWAWAQSVNCGLGFPGYAYLSELTQRSEYRAPAETIASEMTREWIVVKTKGKASAEDDSTGDYADDADPDKAELDRMDDDGGAARGGAEDKIEDILNALDEFGVRDAFRRAAEQDAFFGRSQIFIDIDHGKNDETEVRKLPLVIDPKTIPKGSLRGFRVIEPIWTTPYYYNANDPTAPDFYKPRAWFVLGRMIHSSRLLTFVSREVPDMLKPAYNFGGISLSQLMEPYVFQWLRTRNSVSDLIHTFSIVNLATNLAGALQGDVGAGQGLLDRAKLFTQNRDNQGLMLTDKDTEELQLHSAPLSGLDALQAQAQEHMAAPSHIPLVKLLGITPTGLNASSEGEIKVFYDYVRALQQSFFAKHLKTVIEIIQLHLFGAIDDAITFEFVPLTSPSVKELADIRKGDAEMGARYIEAGVISPEEERERLMTDPNSGYTNLSGPPPEPPPIPGLDPETGEPLKGGPFADAVEKPDNADE